MHPSGDEPLSAQQPPGRWHVDIGAWMASASQADRDALAIDVPGWAGSDDLRRLFDHCGDLLLRGDVVWGSVIQANNNLLDPMAPLYFAGAPGEVVYDPQGSVAPEVLNEVARAVYACKGQIFDDEPRAFIARYLADERTRVFGLDVPPSLAPCPLKVSTTWFEVRGLPLRFMALRHLPLLVSDEHPGLVLPLPARFWPTPFTTAWLASGGERMAAATGKPIYVAPPELAHLQPMSLVEEGFLYYKGQGIAQDYEKARLAWKRGAEQGSFSALRRLAQLYEAGLGVPYDLRRAVEYFRRAAQKGCKDSPDDVERLEAQLAFPGSKPLPSSPDDLCSLALDYLQGAGVVKDVAKAISLLERGASREHAQCLFNLGAIYHNGDDVPRNGRLAMGCLQRAADQGHTAAAEYVAKRKRTLLGIVEWLLRAR